MSTIEKLRKLIEEADAIVIGAGAGLSTAAGFEYSGKNFLNHFKYMHDAYGYTDMYSAGFHSFDDEESFWGYWSKYIYLNRYKVGALPLYQKLYQIIKDKNYFVITTNVDHQFQLSGFNKERLFYTQGDYGLFQCSHCKKTFYNKKNIENMMEHIDSNTHKIPSSLIPVCPICGNKLTNNLRSDDFFVEDEGWNKASKRYVQFLKENKNKKVLFLELGVGFNTPIIIKIPFMKMTYQNPKSNYVVINKGYNEIFEEIQDRTIVLNEDIHEVIEKLTKKGN